MIIMRISNGLGNQLFQYALGRHLAIRNNTTLKLDTTWFNQRDKYPGTDREFILGEYQIVADVADLEERKVVISPRFVPLPNRIIEWLITSRNPYPRIPAKLLNYYQEVIARPESADVNWPYSRYFCQDILDIGDDVYLDGYWQSPNYFDEIPEVLRDELRLRSPLSGKNKEMAKSIDSNLAIGVHVRRGLEKYGTELPLEYYENTMDEMENRVSGGTYYVFSDRPDWAKEHFELGSRRNIEFVDHNRGDEAYEDLRLLRLCDHHIIANSTFSWWGAWLGGAPEQIVLAPGSSMGRHVGSVSEWDYLPEGWECVDF
jgi:hypothetical protein